MGVSQKCLTFPSDQAKLRHAPCAPIRHTPRSRRTRMSVFSWQTIHYADLAAYKVALLPFKKPAWIKGITIHHSAIPTRAQWRGFSTMEGTKNYYIGKGWSAGPHLFLAAMTPTPANNGIWAGTPLATSGIHAGTCNSSHIGIEVIGAYDVEPWPHDVAELVYSTCVTLMRWGKITPAQVQGPRECLNNKSCPGRAIDMNRVRAELKRRLALPG